MPATPQVNLDIRFGGSSDPGWVNVAASNGQIYGYSYTGGDDSVGGLRQVVGTGRDTVPLRLNADRRYHIAQCVFLNDSNSQLSWSGQSNYAGSIIDANTQVETAKYTINVTDTGNENCTIPCDPRIANIEPTR